MHLHLSINAYRCLFMEQADIIEPLFKKAKLAKIPIVKICERAGVAPTTPSRWRRKGLSPNLSTFNKMSRALDELIEEQAA